MEAKHSQMMSELAANCTTQRDKLAELFEAFDLAKLGYDVQETQIKDLYNEVLREHTFLISKDCERLGKKIGDRCTDELDSFLLSDTDYDEYLKLTTAKLAAAGITDAEGYYLTNWLTIKMDAKRALVNFIIDKVLPQAMRKQFEEARRNIVYQDKLIDIIRPTLKMKAA